MKQFQKYGVAAAVASMATGAVATQVSDRDMGDLAIVPYYTVNNGFNTGVHIINTTDSTQVVKFRLRRGADSKDALDFNVVLSPEDEWTASVQADPNVVGGVQVVTGDNSCTVPAFDNGVADMPATFRDGATEGYIEIIGMAQTTDEDQPIAVAAEHDAKGMPKDCNAVRSNFFRVPADNNGSDVTVNGVHNSSTTSSGQCSEVDADVTACATATLASAVNLSSFTDTDDAAFKVSFMVTDSDGGLEFGDNAVMVEGFSDHPMMTNQQQLRFGLDGLLQYDALNFELPNLAQGALDSDRSEAAIASGDMFQDLRDALNAASVVNDWASFETAGASVATDWVVTLPGQYAMTDPVCSIYADYAQSNTACSQTGLGAYSADAQGFTDLPLLLAEQVEDSPVGEGSNLLLWDREEKGLNGQDPDAGELNPPSLDFSPAGTDTVPSPTNEKFYLQREVNVLSFNGVSVLGTSASQSEALGLGVNIDVTGGDRGWAKLDIESTNATPKLFLLQGTDEAGLEPDDDARSSFVAVTGQPAVVGMAVWERKFSGQAGNYGRAIEHSFVRSAPAS